MRTHRFILRQNIHSFPTLQSALLFNGIWFFIFCLLDSLLQDPVLLFCYGGGWSMRIEPTCFQLNRLIDQSINQSIHPSIHPSVYPFIHHSINQSINPSINQSINQSIIHSFNQSINQPINRSITDSSLSVSICQSVKQSILIKSNQ